MKKKVCKQIKPKSEFFPNGITTSQTLCRSSSSFCFLADLPSGIWAHVLSFYHDLGYPRLRMLSKQEYHRDVALNTLQAIFHHLTTYLNRIRINTNGLLFPSKIQKPILFPSSRCIFPDATPFYRTGITNIAKYIYFQLLINRQTQKLLTINTLLDSIKIDMDAASRLISFLIIYYLEKQQEFSLHSLPTDFIVHYRLMISIWYRTPAGSYAPFAYYFYFGDNGKNRAILELWCKSTLCWKRMSIKECSIQKAELKLVLNQNPNLIELNADNNMIDDSCLKLIHNFIIHRNVPRYGLSLRNNLFSNNGKIQLLDWIHDGKTLNRIGLFEGQ